MVWTAEEDTKLMELHAKRLGVRFISVWLRQPAAAVRGRLVELGIEKPLSQRASQVIGRVKKATSVTLRGEEIEIAELDDDEDGELRASRGCPRGHLVSEAKIAALYRSAGADYR